MKFDADLSIRTTQSKIRVSEEQSECFRGGGIRPYERDFGFDVSRNGIVQKRGELSDGSAGCLSE